MRQIEVRTVDQDLKGLFVQGDFTGLSFTKKDINLMLDDDRNADQNWRRSQADEKRAFGRVGNDVARSLLPHPSAGRWPAATP
jgi:hypothetical protein